MDVFTLAAMLTLDSSQYDKGLSSAEKNASGFGKNLKTAFKVGAAAVGLVTTAVGTLTGALVKGAGEVAAYGDNIDKMSQKMGLSAEAYQEWDAIMQHSGTSIESLQSGMKTLANAVESGNDAFARLGITEEEIAGMNNEELFSATIEALQNVENETERTYLAGQLLGRGATELGALLNMSAEETEEMRQRVHELGGVMSDDAVKAAAHYQDSLQDMTTAFSGLKRNLVSEFLPSVTTVMDGLTELFAGRGGLDLISEGVKSFVDTLTESIPQIMETGSGIILALVEAIVDNLPTLLDAAVQAIMTIATGIIDQLPTIVRAGFDVLMSIVNGIVDNLPELIPATIDVILEIIDTLTDPENLGMLIDASIAIIIALAEGLIDALPRLLEKAPEIVANLVEALIENVPKLLEASVQMIAMLVKGLADNLPLVWEKGKEIVNKLWDGITELDNKLNEKAKELMEKFGQGIKESLTAIWNWGKDVVTEVWNGITSLDPLQWGKDMISNFVGGIKQGWENLKQGVSDVAQGVRNFLGFSEPKEGPLSDFHTYAPDMMRLFAEGIRENEDLVTDQLEKSFNFQDSIGNIEPALGTGGGASGQRDGGQRTDNQEIVLYATMEVEGAPLARKMFRFNKSEIERHGSELVQFAR